MPKTKGEAELASVSASATGDASGSIRKNVNKLNVIPFNFEAVLKSLQDSISPPFRASYPLPPPRREANCPNEVACELHAACHEIKLQAAGFAFKFRNIFCATLSHTGAQVRQLHTGPFPEDTC